MSLVAALVIGTGDVLHAQGPEGELDSLRALARRASPSVLAAEARLRAVRAAVSPAGALPDPMLMTGVVNFPLLTPGVRDEMTMKMIGIEQTLPIGGKRQLRRLAAGHDVSAAEATLDAAQRAAVLDVALAYFDIALSDSLLQLVVQQHQLLLTVARAAQSAYGAGLGGQEEPLRAETELIKLSGDVTALRAERARAVARVNALLGRPSNSPVGAPMYPARMRRAVLVDSVRGAQFADSTPGALALGSPLPSTDSLQVMAVTTSPMIRAHLAELAAQSARVNLAARDARPDPTFSLQYGQRTGLTDMVSATVSVPIPIWRNSKQDQLTAAARATFVALEHEHHRMVAELEAEVVDLAQTAELHRTRLALYQSGLLPRARAAAEAALAGYRTGRTSFQAALDAYVSLNHYEADAVRLLTEFAKTVEALEALTGQELVS